MSCTGNGSANRPRTRRGPEDEDPAGGRYAGEPRLAGGRARAVWARNWCWPTPARKRCAIFLNDDFAAILLDVRMPDMDGFETAELIRSRPRSRQIPILFLTGYQKRRTPVSRLRSGRGRFSVQAHRAGSAALQSGGVRGTQPQQRQAEGTGRRAAEAGRGAAEGRAEIPVAAGSRARRHGDVPRGRRNRDGQFADRGPLQLRAGQADVQEHPDAGAGLGIPLRRGLGRRLRPRRRSARERERGTARFPRGPDAVSRSRSASARCRPRKAWSITSAIRDISERKKNRGADPRN